TTNFFDYSKVINPPGDCLTIDRSSLPPLKPGRYYVGVLNPIGNPVQNITISWRFGLDVNGVVPSLFTTTNSSSPLLDDAVTNNVIKLTTNNIKSIDQKIAQVNVGVVLQHPRVSDLDITLISPTGQRIMLFENRGGPSATNMGHLNIITNFFGPVASGGANASTNFLGPLPTTSGTLV